MKNPFNTINITNGKDNASLVDKKDLYYVQIYAESQKFLFAMGVYDSFAKTIFDMACFAMNIYGECEVSYKELDAALGIKQPKTRTKSLNVLRALNFIKTTNANKAGKVIFYVNAKVAWISTQSLRSTQAKFFAELPFEALGEDGFIKKTYIDSYRAYEKNDEKYQESQIPF